ncbi:type IVB secretion system protein IcmH/DotU [Methylomonas sp. AM2-LC]|uniref:type IVB secretion system protein IcmH/DotU n=1 Tax=Methylomonas sp. AM2-LC TaxID=3153301 RepID=UPI00326412A4
MAQEGPFNNDDKTVLRPTPGGRISAQQAAPRNPAPPPQAVSDVLIAESLSGDKSGSFLALSAGILSLAARLRVTASYDAVNELKQKLAKEVSEFERQSLAKGIQQEKVRMASYALCTFLDEVIQNTPWGAQSNWGHQSLLILFHKEAFGGERFFQIIDNVVKQPAQNLQIIEFFYVLLSFGFEGKYRLIANGMNSLEKQRQELYQLIQRVSGDYVAELSPRWQGQNTNQSSLISHLPLWVFASVAAGLLLLCYLGFSYAVNTASDPVYTEILKLARDPALALSAQPSMPVSQPVSTRPKLERFKPLLQNEIANNMVEVVDDSILRIRNSFPSGSDQVKPEFIPMLNKIAKELESQQDSVLITGHTDDKRIVSAKFPSNWHLSLARAKNVLTVLQETAHLTAARAEGRADAEPLAANDSAENRALNRRVDILVK